MLIDIFILVLGAFLIWGGANYMTDGSSALARRWGVNEVVIGITVVAFGSSAPDLAVCLLAVFHNHEGLALGNVVGSNIFDVFMVVGVCWLIKPLRITDRSIIVQTAFMVLVYTVILIFSNSRFLDHDSQNLISRSDGFILLILYALYMYAVFISQKFNVGTQKFDGETQKFNVGAQKFNGDTQKFNGDTRKFDGDTRKFNAGTQKFNGDTRKFDGDTQKFNAGTQKFDGDTWKFDGDTQKFNGTVQEFNAKPETKAIIPVKEDEILEVKGEMTDNYELNSKTNSETKPQTSISVVILYIVGGLGALIGGGEIFVKGATGIARDLHISEAMIGLTVVALGTSLPDLATSLVAVLKKENGIAMGNVIGSCLFDGLIVLGTCSLFKPLPLGTVSNIDLLTMLGGGLFFWLSSRYFRSQIITRVEGGILIIGYVIYTLYLIFKVAHL